MTIVELLKKENVRISYGNRWLVWDENYWCVYERKPYQKKTREIIKSRCEDGAIEKLIRREV